MLKEINALGSVVGSFIDPLTGLEVLNAGVDLSATVLTAQNLVLGRVAPVAVAPALEPLIIAPAP